MDEFPGNKNMGRREPEKQEPKRVERVVSGEVVTRKMPLGKRLTQTFIGGNAKSVWDYIVLDVLMPAAKDAIADSVSQGAERMIFGESRPRNRGSRGSSNAGPVGHIAYNRYAAGPPRDEPRREISKRSRTVHDFREIIIPGRAEAEEVIDRLFDLVAKYDSATVADLYELVGISGNYTDDKWGWVSLQGASVSRARNGYLLNLPQPEPLD